MNKEKKQNLEEGFKNVISSMLSGQEKQRASLYEKILLESDFRKHFKLDEDGFDASEFHLYIQYPFEQFLQALLANQLKINSQSINFVLDSNFYKNHFESLIRKFEGSSCCADKSSTIIRAIYKYLTKGEKIEFNFSGEYTFHLPKTIFKTHDSIMEFYEALESLYYGDSEKYLQFLLKLSKQINVNKMNR